MCSRRLKKEGRRGVSPCTADVLVPLIGTFIFSPDWAVSLPSRRSTSSGFRRLKCTRATAQRLSSSPRVKRGEIHWQGAWSERAASIFGPRFLCHQLVTANNARSVNSYAALFYTRAHRTVKCRAGGVDCMMSSPAYFVITPSVSLLGRRRRGEVGWPFLNSVL